jgi:hypothetical protein
MRNLNTTITVIRFISNPNHPIRLFCLNPIELDECALQPAASKPLFVRAMEYFGKLQIDTRKIERLPQYFRPQRTNIDHNRFVYEPCAIRLGASNDRFQAFSTKSTNITAKYRQTDRKRRKGRLRRSTK